MSPCPICADVRRTPLHTGRDRLYRTTRDAFSLIRCARCGMARLDPVPEDLARFYPAGYWHRPTRLQEIYRRLTIADHVAFARRALGAGRRVLDVGCGSGLFLNRLRAPEGFGLDTSPRAAAVAREVYGVEVVVGDLARAPFRATAFDLITMFHVLEHLPDPGAYVEAARRLLAPGGRLVVQTPNLDSWQYRVFGPRWIGLDVPRHLCDFRARDLRRLLEDRGFRILREKHFSWRDNAACLATTVAPAWEPVARASRGLPPRGLAYLALTAAALPFAVAEAACGRGATVMLEALC